jgi:hypothetical protein
MEDNQITHPAFLVAPKSDAGGTHHASALTPIIGRIT